MTMVSLIGSWTTMVSWSPLWWLIFASHGQDWFMIVHDASNQLRIMINRGWFWLCNDGENTVVSKLVDDGAKQPTLLNDQVFVADGCATWFLGLCHPHQGTNRLSAITCLVSFKLKFLICCCFFNFGIKTCFWNFVNDFFQNLPQITPSTLIVNQHYRSLGLASQAG